MSSIWKKLLIIFKCKVTNLWTGSFLPLCSSGKDELGGAISRREAKKARIAQNPSKAAPYSHSETIFSVISNILAAWNFPTRASSAAPARKSGQCFFSLA